MLGEGQSFGRILCLVGLVCCCFDGYSDVVCVGGMTFFFFSFFFFFLLNIKTRYPSS